MLTIRTYDANGSVVTTIEAKYVSLISDSTFGPPPVVAPRDGKPPIAKLEDTVVFINPAAVGLFTITRDKDPQD